MLYYQTGMVIRAGQEHLAAELGDSRERRVGVLLVTISSGSPGIRLGRRIVLIAAERMHSRTYRRETGHSPIAGSTMIWVASMASIYVWIHPESGAGCVIESDDPRSHGWLRLWRTDSRDWEDCISRAVRNVRGMVENRELAWAGTGTRYSVYITPKKRKVEEWRDMHDLMLDAVWSTMSREFPNEATITEISQ